MRFKLINSPGIARIFQKHDVIHVIRFNQKTQITQNGHIPANYFRRLIKQLQNIFSSYGQSQIRFIGFSCPLQIINLKNYQIRLISSFKRRNKQSYRKLIDRKISIAYLNNNGLFRRMLFYQLIRLFFIIRPCVSRIVNRYNRKAFAAKSIVPVHIKSNVNHLRFFQKSLSLSPQKINILLNKCLTF